MHRFGVQNARQRSPSVVLYLQRPCPSIATVWTNPKICKAVLIGFKAKANYVLSPAGEAEEERDGIDDENKSGLGLR
jgi:hypothetical protein